MKELWPYIKPYRIWIVLLFLLGIVSSGAALVIPGTIGKSIDQFVVEGFSPNSTLIFLSVIVVIGLAASVIQLIVGTTVTEHLAVDLRSALAKSLARQPYAFVQKHSSAKLLTNFTSDIDEVKVVISQGFVTILSAIFMIVGSAIMLFTIDVKLALSALATMPILIIVFQVVMRRIRKLFQELRSNTDRLNKVISESIIGSTIVRVLFAQKHLDANFDGANREARDIGYRLLATFGSFFPLLNVLSSISIVVVIWYGGWKVLHDQLTIGQFTAFYTYLAGLITPIFILGFVSNIFIRAGVAFSRMKTVLTAVPVIEGGTVVPSMRDTISFTDVSFMIDKKPILRNVSFDIPFGKYTAIIGPTAAGKTHVLYMLLGLIQPDEGELRIDDIQFNDIDRAQWRLHTGMVFQGHVIFQGSLRDNIALGHSIPDEDIWQALHVADLEEFAKGLENGLDSIVSERGTNLSGGQKQRVSLARALVHKPDILLLDDFIARVDMATNKRIRDRFTEAFPHQTRIVVSQTIESIVDADHIIVLMEGEVLATGTHDELMKHSFEYQQIAESQQNTENGLSS